MGRLILTLGFGTLGFLIGNLAGLTAESTVSALLSLLFAFAGGSAIGLLHKLDANAQKSAGLMVASLSIMCLTGVYSGIIVTEHQLLTPVERRQYRVDDSIEESKYLRSYLINEAAQIDQLRATNQISVEQAYESLYQLLRQSD